LPPSNAKYAICFSVRSGVDPIAVAERIAGPHPYIGAVADTDQYAHKWQCTPIPTNTTDGMTALHDAEHIWEQVRGDRSLTGSYLRRVGPGDMFGH